MKALQWTHEVNHGVTMHTADACEGLAYIIVGDDPECSPYRRTGTTYRRIGDLPEGHFTGSLEECKAKCQADNPNQKH